MFTGECITYTRCVRAPIEQKERGSPGRAIPLQRELPGRAARRRVHRSGESHGLLRLVHPVQARVVVELGGRRVERGWFGFRGAHAPVGLAALASARSVRSLGLQQRSQGDRLRARCFVRPLLLRINKGFIYLCFCR
jgi:hypothetical protein